MLFRSTLLSQRGIPTHIPELARPLTLQPFFSHELKAPPSQVQGGLTALHQVPGFSNVFLVLHQKGMIWRMEKRTAGEEKTVFADLTGEVFSERGPNGLLNMAFHPGFRENRKYYLKHQVFEQGKVATVILEKSFSDDFTGDSGRPPRRVLKIESVAEDHSGGCLQFGPDGYLYVVMGDTGPHNDPNGHAQNLSLLLGKLLPYFGLGMGGMVVSTVFGLTVFGLPFAGSFLVLLLASSLFMLVVLGFGLMASTITRNQFSASIMALTATMLPGMLLSGFIFDIRSMNPVVQVITHIVPARYFVEILKTLFLAGDIWAVILPNLGALALMAAILLTITARKTTRSLE